MEQSGELLTLFCREKLKAYDPFLWLPSSVNRCKKILGSCSKFDLGLPFFQAAPAASWRQALRNRVSRAACGRTMGGVGSRRVGKWSYPCLGNARSLHRERDIFPACHRLLSVHIFIATSSHAAILNSLGPYHQQFSKDQGRESHPESSDWHVTSVPVATWSLTRILVSGEVGVLRRHGSSVVKSRSDHLGNTCP